MALLKGQLGKFTIIFYPKSAAPGIGVPFTPMYNPTEFSVTYKANYDSVKAPGTEDIVKKFTGIAPRTVSFNLFFDGTGASPSSVGGLGNLSINSGIQSVEAQVQLFRRLAYQIVGESHKPNYLMVIWGTFVMTGVLDSAEVQYTMFASDGTPLRAKMKITVNEHIDDTLLGKILKLSSPDLSKSITVNEGDTLPLMCFREYGNAALYTQVAKVNGLKNYRSLEKGMRLLFPPINDLD